jgi:hypothetical protein
MCVIAFAWNVHPRWQLLLVGNRDELHARSSAPLHRWTDDAGLLAGRDLQAGGTWMGVREPSRAAVVTRQKDLSLLKASLYPTVRLTAKDVDHHENWVLAQVRAAMPRVAANKRHF